MSLLYTLFYVACAGNASTPGSLARLVTTGNGAQDSRFVGGSQLVAIRVARRLGRRVVLRAPVRRIETIGKDAVTVTADGVGVAARRVVVAVPPVLAARIDYAPALPSAKRRLLRAITPGNLVKLEAVYDRPFWRDQGLSGQGVSISGTGTLPFDNSPPQGTPGIVFSFVGADGARALPVTAAARRAAFTENLVAFFGDEDFWFGYMDGAVRSGERVSREVVRSLRR